MIHAYGDSHVSFLRGDSTNKIISYSEYPEQYNLPLIRSNFISSFTSHSLITKIVEFKTMIEREFKNNSTAPQDDILAFMFGEVDIRNHISKHILEFKLKYGEHNKDLFINTFYEIQKVIQRYLCFLEIIKGWFPNNEFLIILPPAQCEKSVIYDTYDTMENRNKLTEQFCVYLKKELELRQFYYIDIFSRCLIPGTYKTNTSLYHDDLHLKYDNIEIFKEEYKKLLQ